MRAEDIQAINRAMAILKILCQENKKCSTCKLYAPFGCLLAHPPVYIDTDSVIEAIND